MPFVWWMSSCANLLTLFRSQSRWMVINQMFNLAPWRRQTLRPPASVWSRTKKLRRYVEQFLCISMYITCIDTHSRWQTIEAIIHEYIGFGYRRKSVIVSSDKFSEWFSCTFITFAIIGNEAKTLKRINNAFGCDRGVPIDGESGGKKMYIILTYRMIDIVCCYLVIHSAKTITVLHLYFLFINMPLPVVSNCMFWTIQKSISISFSFGQLQCSEEIHQLVLQVENFVKPQASNEAMRPSTVRKNQIVMDSSKNKRVAQWLESHPSAMPLPPVANTNTDCEASCEYTTGKAQQFSSHSIWPNLTFDSFQNQIRQPATPIAPRTWPIRWQRVFQATAAAPRTAHPPKSSAALVICSRRNMHPIGTRHSSVHRQRSFHAPSGATRNGHGRCHAYRNWRNGPQPHAHRSKLPPIKVWPIIRSANRHCISWIPAAALLTITTVRFAVRTAVARWSDVACAWRRSSAANPARTIRTAAIADRRPSASASWVNPNRSRAASSPRRLCRTPRPPMPPIRRWSSPIRRPAKWKAKKICRSRISNWARSHRTPSSHAIRHRNWAHWLRWATTTSNRCVRRAGAPRTTVISRNSRLGMTIRRNICPKHIPRAVTQMRHGNCSISAMIIANIWIHSRIVAHRCRRPIIWIQCRHHAIERWCRALCQMRIMRTARHRPMTIIRCDGVAHTNWNSSGVAAFPTKVRCYRNLFWLEIEFPAVIYNWL